MQNIVAHHVKKERPVPHGDGRRGAWEGVCSVGKATAAPGTSLSLSQQSGVGQRRCAVRTA